MTIAKSILVSALSLLATAAIAQPLVIDSSFNSTGYHMRVNEFSQKMLQLPDGNVFVAGRKGDSLSLWRFLPNGTMDMSFGYNGAGSVKTPATFPSTAVVDILQHRNKKITVLVDAEYMDFTTPSNGDASIMLIRYNSNGTPDLSFSSNGYIISRPQAGHFFNARCMALDTAGAEDALYVATTGGPSGFSAAPNRWSISKYKMNGTLDPSFNTTGHLQGVGADINPGTAPLAVIHDMKVMANGRLLVAGAHRGSDQAWMLFRLKPDGSFDNTFANNGRVHKPVNYQVPSNELSSGYIHPDGSVTQTTQTTYAYSNIDTCVVNFIRFNADGSTANNFGTNGLKEIKFTNGKYRYAFDSTKRILVSWYKPVDPVTKQRQQINFARLTTTGSIDTSFGNGTGHVVSEPVLSDAYYNQSHMAGITYTPDFKGVYLIANRSTTNLLGHGIYRYKFVLPKPSQVSTIKALTAHVYPVPATDQLHITTPGMERISSVFLYNMTGQMVTQQTGIDNNQHVINTSALAPGQYMLSVYGTTGSRLQQTIMVR